MNDPRDEVPEDETQPILTLEDVAIKIEHDQPIVDSTAFGVLVDRDGTVYELWVLSDLHQKMTWLTPSKRLPRKRRCAVRHRVKSLSRLWKQQRMALTARCLACPTTP